MIICNLAVCTFIAFSDMNEVGTYGSKEVLSGTENSVRPNTQGETVHLLILNPMHNKNVRISQK